MNRRFDDRRKLLKLAAATALPSVARKAMAQSPFPNKPIKVIVPQPPGGGFDTVARLLADRLGKALNQNVLVENRPGSGTLVGTEAAARAPADGYNLLLGSVSNLALNMGLYKNLPYDSLKDFEPLCLAVSYGYTLIGRKDLPQNSLRDVIAFAKANPGKLTYASAGNGSGQHILAAALWHLTGVQVLHVPYRGAQAAYQDLLGGRVDMFFDIATTARTQVDAGTVKALAVSNAERNPVHPQVPTITESGVAQLDLESWFGYFAPSKTPADIQERLRTELAKIIAQPDLQDIFRKGGGRPLTLNASQTKALVERDVQRWSKLVRELDIKPE